MLYGLSQARQIGGISILFAGVGLIAVFVWHAARKGNAALIDLRLFGNSVFSTSAATQFLSNGVFYARQFLVPLFLITGCALTANRAGWLMAALGVGMLGSFPLVGTLTDRFGCRAVSAGGAGLALVGVLPFLWMTEETFSPVLTVLGLLAMGAGQGTINIPSVSAAYASVQKDRLAVATTAINIVQRLGGPLATTLVSVVLSLSVSHLPAAGPRAFLTAFLFLIGIQALTLASATRLPVRLHKQPERPERESAQIRSARPR